MAFFKHASGSLMTDSMKKKGMLPVEWLSGKKLTVPSGGSLLPHNSSKSVKLKALNKSSIP